MQLEHDFVVPVPRNQAWAVLLDVRQVAACMPGATLLNVDADTFTGRIKIKVGPITVAYRGSAEFAERDDTNFRVVLKATGREERGGGQAAATVTVLLSEVDDSHTKVAVVTDLDVTGKPAQFGRGVIDEVGATIIRQFADRLSAKIAPGPDDATSSPDSASPGATAAPPAPAATDTATGIATPVPDSGDAVLNLGKAAWLPVVRRIAPAAAGLLGGLLLGRLVSGRPRPAVHVVVAALPIPGDR